MLQLVWCYERDSSHAMAAKRFLFLRAVVKGRYVEARWCLLFTILAELHMMDSRDIGSRVGN